MLLAIMFRFRATCLLSQVIQKSLHSSQAISRKQNHILTKLQAEFTDVSYVTKTVNKEEVKHIDYKEWKNRIVLFKQYGFEDADCFQMISLYPTLLKIPESDLKLHLEQWVNAELGSRNFQLILIKHPHLLEVSDSSIRKRLPILRAYFRGVSALSQLIINCPNVMYENWNELCSKINYLIEEKRFKMGDVLKTSALSKDLDFIKLRFHVAEKCGIYKQQSLMPHKETKYKKLNSQNPSLKYIIQDKDENFAKYVAKITLEEYLAAKDLFIYESNEDNAVDDDDDDDDEVKYK